MEYIEYTTKFGNKGKRRINPNTNEMFKRGDKLEDGSVFISYDSNITSLGYFVEKWDRPKNFESKPIHKRKPKNNSLVYRYYYDLPTRTAKRKKVDCKKLGIPFNLDPEYLKSIYPDNGLCPVFGIEMVEGGEPFDRPELDRINPGKGYVKGNVAWICGRANNLKSDGCIEEFQCIIDYIKNNP